MACPLNRDALPHVAYEQAVMGIDPGSEKSAGVLYWPSNEIVLASPGGTNKLGNEAFLAWIREHAPRSAHCAVEVTKPYTLTAKASGKAYFPGQLMDAGYWGGRFAQCWAESSGADVEVLDRHDAKRHLLGKRKGTDADIRAAIIRRFGKSKACAVGTKRLPGPLYGVSGDAWAALAVAITYAETRV